MAIDFENAFDLLEFSVINKVIKFLNFGPTLYVVQLDKRNI